MAFTYTTEPRLTQHLLTGGVVALALLLGTTEGFARAWSALIAATSPRVLFTGGLMAMHTVVFWSVALAFHAVDRTDRPQWIARHRIQRSGRKHPDLRRTVRVLLRNQFLYLPVLLFLAGEVLLLRGWQADPALPSLGRLALELGGQAVIATIVFYATHRFLHRRWWMKRVHRVHHEFKTTTALAAEYAHPVEFTIGNFAALATGALLIAPHLASIYLFALVALLTILVHHSGYALPWASWAVPHDWHHYRMNELFGTTGLLDRWLGTSPRFEALEEGEHR